MLDRPHFIASDIYRASTYGRQHPLAIPRVSTVVDLLRALGWLDPAVYVDAACATPDDLARFHDRPYIEALRQAERDQRVAPEIARRYNIGINGNPVFREIYSRPATSCGATLAAVDLLAQGGIVYSPAGGTHHGRPDRASGFCYFNDPVLGILKLIDQGYERIYYVDLDAHHCDGVQDALAGEPAVTLASIHERGRWPHTGAAEDIGGGNAVNLPVDPGFNDDELDLLVDRVLVPLGVALRPQIVIIQCGADALAEDPLSKLALSNRALWRSVGALRGLAPRLLVLGGGGYNPWSVARCWAGVWAVLNDIEVPVDLPFAAETVLRSLTWARSAGRNPPERWFTTLADPPQGGGIRDETRALAAGGAQRIDDLVGRTVRRPTQVHVAKLNSGMTR